MLIYQHGSSATLLLITRAQRMQHVHSLGSSRSFIKQRAVGQWHASEVGHSSLEVHQCFQSAL